MDHLSNSSFAPFVPHQAFVGNGRLPEAPGVFAQDRRSRLMGAGLNFGRPYVPASRPGAGSGLDFRSEIQGPGIQNPYQMEQFLAGEQPWTGMSGQPPSRAPEGSSFSAYRTTRLPSDCGTRAGLGILPSDSGYESITRQSVANLSVVGEPDRSPDVLGLSLPNFATPHGANQGSLEYPRETWSQPSTTGPPDSFATSRTAEVLVCPDCNALVKTKSELKKHEARHSKPYSCKKPGCKNEGFATSNDLERHQKSVHGAPGLRYRCQHDDKCRKKAKAWPRADNFKEHLKRVHKLTIGRDFDLEPYKWEDWHSENLVLASIGVAPEQNPTFDPANLRTETNDGIFQTDSADGGDPFSSDIELSFPSHVDSASGQNFDEPIVTNTNLPEGADESMNETAEYGLQDCEVSVEGAEFDTQDAMSIDSEVDDQAASQLYEPAMHSENGISQDGDIELTDDPPPLNVAPGLGTGPQEPVHAERAGSPDRPKSAIDITERIDPSNVAEASAFIKRLEDKGLLQTLMEQHGYQKAKEPSVEPSLTAVSSPSPASKTSSSGKMVKCDKCGKLFPRKCELKKHMKRHEKPYGCTFEGCNGSFGSKNDWKRHENSQHFQLDIWRCDEKADDASGGVCAKFYHRRESFKNHLKKCHGIDDSKIVDDKMNSCRMDCSRQTQFWCGFCRTIISSNKNGLSAWNERYNHIEAHLQGRGCEKKEMKDWQRDDEDSLEADTLASGSVDGGGESAPETTRDNTTAATNTAGDLAILHESLLARKRAGDGDSPACKRAKESDSPSSRRLRNGDSPVPEREVDNGGLRRFWLCCDCHNYMACDTWDSCFQCESHHNRCDDCRIEERPLVERVILQ